MAYFALINLRNTIRCLENFSRLSELPYSFDNLDYPFDEIDFLKKVVQELDGRSRNKRLKAFYDKIREAAHGLEDAVESVLSDLIRIAQSDDQSMLKELWNEYEYSLPDEEEDDDDDDEDSLPDEEEEEDDDDDDDEDSLPDKEEDDDDEDVNESFLSDLIRTLQSDDQSVGTQRPSMYEEEVRKGLYSFVETVKVVEEEYKNKLKHLLPDEEEDDEEENEFPRFHFCEKKPKMVGAYTQELITKIKDQLHASYKSSELRVISIVGVPGSGRSTFAWDIFRDPKLPYLHKLRALVRVGPKYEFKDILLSILSQIDCNDHKLLDSEGEEKIFEYLHTILKEGDYLIVLDDLRETRVWEYLRKLFPDENNGSRVLLTTHLEEVAAFARSFSIHRMSILHSEESWNIISRVLFPNGQRCPPELEISGKNIAKKCKGLLFEVARYANILSKVEQTLENWDNVAAEMVDFAVDVDAYDEISEIFDMMDHTRFLPPKMSEALGLPNATYPIWRNVCIFSINVAVVGMAGIGKTALARKIFDDPWTLRSYEHRVWLTLGPQYQLKRILADILAELVPNISKMHTEADETLFKQINSVLSGKRCFIVLDDVWDENPRHVLRNLLYGIKCEVLFTTRLSAVAWEYFGEFDKDKVHDIQLLNKEESWSLLRERVFGEELCPRELEKPGKLIAENCEGLPLMIVTVASLLSRDDENTPKYWNMVATNKNSVFEEAYLKISKILYPSYKNLDLKYRACFLYMAAFHVNYQIPDHMLFSLYNAEGIIPSGSWTMGDFHHYLSIVSGKSLVWYYVTDDNFWSNGIHSVFWHFCVREARNDKFFHVMRTRADGSSEDIEKQRRLCVQNSVLFAIKDVYDSMASISTARSLLCFGPTHPYQVPICLESKFLKVLDAFRIRFYEFPVEISTLVLLRYLALTYNGALPTSISKLWNLEFLIISPYRSIKFPGDLSYIPVEIWEMKELKHLQIRGSNLPDPPNSSSAILYRLIKLMGVRAESVTKRILERIPNLEELFILIELEPDHASLPSFSFDPMSHLKRLTELTCEIRNPELKYTPAPFSILPSCLRILNLSGCGYPWEQMTPIALLPNLIVLNLKCYAFQGAEWVMQEGYFNRLQELYLEDIDLVNWRADDSCYLISLRTLTIKWCFKLKEIPWQNIPPTCYTKLVDCPLASKEMPENNCKVICSWIERRKI